MLLPPTFFNLLSNDRTYEIQMSSCVCVEQRQLNVAVRLFNISCLFLSTVPHSPHLAKVVSLCLAFEVIAVESGFSSG